MGVLIGYAMFATLVLGLFALLVWIIGLKHTVLIFAATAALTMFTYVAEYLIRGGQF